MSRKIVIDSDTYVGYDFINKRYYIGNKGTETTRGTSSKAKEVLDIVAPDNTVTQESIQALEDNTEQLQNLYYTWSDEGDYIKTIQLNDYSEHPITLDLQRKKLYIMNSELVFDITLNEGRSYRSSYIASYFEKYIGFGWVVENPDHSYTNKFEKQIESIYDLMMSYYNPTVYNQIDEESIVNVSGGKPLKYNNVFGLTNYNGKGVAKYTCTLNPDSKYVPTTISGIAVMEAQTGLIAITGSVTALNLQAGDEILVSGSDIYSLGVEYSNDGKYTIASVDTEEDAFYVEGGALAVDYIFPYWEAVLIGSAVNISSISSSSSSITLASACPDTIVNGSEIWVQGTTQEVQNETVSLDGKYTVVSISANRLVLTVAETPAFNFTYTSGDVFVYKKIPLSPILSISENTVHLMNGITGWVGNGTVQIVNTDGVGWFTATSGSPDTSGLTSLIYLQFATPISYVPVYPALQKNYNVDTVLINTTETNNTVNFPIGMFSVDDFEQCKEYISTCEYIVVPTNSILDNIGNPIPSSMMITFEDGSTINMQSLGVYSMVYSDIGLKG